MAAHEDGTPNVDIGLCIFAPRVAKEIERRNTFQAKQLGSRREPQNEQRQREERRTLSHEQMPPPPRPCDGQSSSVNMPRRRNDESQRESRGLSKTKVTIPPGPQDPQLSRTNGEPDGQFKSARHRRMHKQVRRNFGLDQRNSKDESNHAEDLPESSVARLPGLVELCTTAFIMLTLKHPCPRMNALTQKPGPVPDQTRSSKLVISEATKAHTRRDQHRKARTASPMPNSHSALPLEPASVSTQEKTFFLDELMEFYQTRELHTINTGPATLYSCAAHDANVEGAILAYPSFILLHAGKKYPEWPDLCFSSTEDTEEEFGCIHSLPRVHEDRQLDPVPVFKEVTWLFRKVSATDLEESDGGTRSNTAATGTVVERSVPATPNPGINRMTESGKRAKTAHLGKTTHPLLSEDSNEPANGRDFEDACPEDSLRGRRATFLGWYDILGVRYEQRWTQPLYDEIQRKFQECINGVRVHPPPQNGSATQPASPNGAGRHNGEVRKETQMPPEGPTADVNPIEKSNAATPGRMSPPPRPPPPRPPPPRPPPPLGWEPFNPVKRALTFEFSMNMEARASAQPPSSSSPAPSSHPQSETSESPIPFFAHIMEKDCWTQIFGAAFVNVTLEPASDRSLARVVDRHGEETLTNPLTKGYKHSVTVADDGLSCEIEGTDARDGDAVYDALERRFERACAVRDRKNNGGGGDDGTRGQGGDVNGGDDQIDHVAGEESSTNANGTHNAANHDHGDNDSPDDIAGKDKSHPPANTTKNPVPPPSLTYRPSMTFTLPSRMTNPTVESLDLTKSQRIIRQSQQRDLQHILNILQGMCRLQSHRHLLAKSTLHLREIQKLENEYFERQEKRLLDRMREMVARGEVQPSWTRAWEAMRRWRVGNVGRGGRDGGAGKERESDVLAGKERDGGVLGESERETCKGDEEEGVDAQVGDKPDEEEEEEEGSDSTVARPMTQEEEEEFLKRPDFLMTW